jgi:hypothetical protein
LQARVLAPEGALSGMMQYTAQIAGLDVSVELDALEPVEAAPTCSGEGLKELARALARAAQDDVGSLPLSTPPRAWTG